MSASKNPALLARANRYLNLQNLLPDPVSAKFGWQASVNWMSELILN